MVGKYREKFRSSVDSVFPQFVRDCVRTMIVVQKICSFETSCSFSSFSCSLSRFLHAPTMAWTMQHSLAGREILMLPPQVSTLPQCCFHAPTMLWPVPTIISYNIPSTTRFVSTSSPRTDECSICSVRPSGVSCSLPIGIRRHFVLKFTLINAKSESYLRMRRQGLVYRNLHAHVTRGATWN